MMKGVFISVLFLLSVSFLFGSEAERVLLRLVGEERAAQFSLIEEGGANPWFEVEAKDGKINIRANNGVSAARGAYHYLKESCNVMIGWGGSQMNLPARFPDMEKVRIKPDADHLLYYNVCVYGYTNPFWHWEDWEKELDWMALHGINMPVMMMGQEYILQKIWNELGISNDDLKDHFVGPAYLPWQRMGNISKWDGPLPQSFIDGKRQLTKKVMARMRALGMNPVVPSFPGFIPEEFHLLYPDEPTHQLSSWPGFPPEDKDHLVWFLDPASEKYSWIQKRFIDLWQENYGDSKYYLCDPFNEVEVPTPHEQSAKIKALTEYGEIIYDSIISADSDAIWVMQGWMFFFDRGYWGREETAAFLKNVPDNRMIILDLGNELFHGWQQHDAFYGKEWIYSMIPTFGGNNPVSGDLKLYSDGYRDMMKDENRGAVVGAGLSPEGVENNDVVYELFTDRVWKLGNSDLDEWIKEYCVDRYGSCSDSMQEAWKLFMNSVYSQSNWGYKFGVMRQPKRKFIPPVPNNVNDFLNGAELFASCASECWESELYRSDLVEFTNFYLSRFADQYLQKAVKTVSKKKRVIYTNKAIETIKLMDSLCLETPHLNLERWIEDARGWGVTEEEADYYERDAKHQVTRWGLAWNLYDYSAKNWSGLMRDYYAPRWENWLLNDGKHGNFDIDAWELEWIKKKGISNAKPLEDFRATIEWIYRQKWGEGLKGSSSGGASMDFLY